MASFQLLCGVHIVRTGERDPENKQIVKRTVEAGAVIEDDRPLDEMFPNKWRRLDGPTRNSKNADHSLDNSGRVTDKPLHLRTKKELARAGHDNIVDPPMPGDKLAIMGAAKDGKSSKKKAKLAAQAELNARGFKAKAKDGARVRGESPDSEEQEEDEFFEDNAEELEEEKPKKKKKKEVVEEEEDEVEDETDDQEETEGDDEAEEEEEPPAPKVMKSKKKKKKKI